MKLLLTTLLILTIINKKTFASKNFRKFVIDHYEEVDGQRLGQCSVKTSFMEKDYAIFALECNYDYYGFDDEQCVFITKLNLKTENIKELYVGCDQSF